MSKKEIRYKTIYIKSKKDLPKIEGVYFVMKHHKRSNPDGEGWFAAYDEITIAGFFPSYRPDKNKGQLPHDYIKGWMKEVVWYLLPEDKLLIWNINRYE